MTFIPKKIRLLPLSIAVMTALSFSTVAFATTTNVNYVTSYGLDGTNVTVSATATGVVSGDQITFLVNTKPLSGLEADISKDDILYIDQQVATSSVVNFTFTTTNGKFTDSTYAYAVKFGASGTASGTDYHYATTNSSNILYSASPRLVTNPLALVQSTSGTLLKDKFVLAFGNITNGGSGVGTYDYGILYSTVSGELDKVTTYEYVTSLLSTRDPINGDLTFSFAPHSRKFAGSNRNTSDQFAVKLIDNSSGKLQGGNKIYTRTYAAYTDTAGKNVVTLGNIIETTCN